MCMEVSVSTLFKKNASQMLTHSEPLTSVGTKASTSLCSPCMRYLLSHTVNMEADKEHIFPL